MIPPSLLQRDDGQFQPVGPNETRIQFTGLSMRSRDSCIATDIANLTNKLIVLLRSVNCWELWGRKPLSHNSHHCSGLRACDESYPLPTFHQFHDDFRICRILFIPGFYICFLLCCDRWCVARICDSLIYSVGLLISLLTRLHVSLSAFS